LDNAGASTVPAVAEKAGAMLIFRHPTEPILRSGF
jgi:hypothetical protein